MRLGEDSGNHPQGERMIRTALPALAIASKATGIFSVHGTAHAGPDLPSFSASVFLTSV